MSRDNVTRIGFRPPRTFWVCIIVYPSGKALEIYNNTQAKASINLGNQELSNSVLHSVFSQFLINEGKGIV